MNRIVKEVNALFNHNKSHYIKNIRADFPIFNFRRYKNIIIFGAAYAGNVFFELCKKNAIKVTAVCDNDPKKIDTFFNGVKIVSIKELQKYPKSTPIVVTIMHDYIVRDQLNALSFFNVWSHAYFSVVYPGKFDNHNFPNSVDEILKSKKKILSTLDLFNDLKSKQTFLEMIKYRLTLKIEGLKKIAEPIRQIYFSPGLINLNKDEVFVDGGAYFGDTIAPFLKYSKNNFKKILAFEPDGISFKLLSNYVSGLKDQRISIFHNALGKKNKWIKFNFQNTAGSRSNKYGKNKIKVVSLDSLIRYKPTLIKLDIEGSESEAISGAKKILRKYKPKLAVCVYHKPEDLWSLPNQIKFLNPAYKLFLRQHSISLHDTVCYAI